MQHALELPLSGSIDPEAQSTLNVVIAYEDFETGKHAKKTFDYLVENLRQDCRFTNQMWKFDVLSIPKLCDIAVKDALMADIVIVSCQGGVLPGQVEAWIEGWLAREGNALALVALFTAGREDNPGTRAVRAYLAGAAKRGGMEFFAQPDEWPGRKRQQESAAFPNAKDLGERTLSALAGVVQRDVHVPRWGFID